MVALRAIRGFADVGEGEEPAMPQPNPGDWLTLEQAACELGVSASTVRRRMRRGELRNRVVPRKGGFAYRIYIRDSRHGRDPGLHGHAPAVRGTSSARVQRPPHDLAAYRRNRAALEAEQAATTDATIEHLEQQVERLSHALTSALRPKAAAADAGGSEPDAPYARYRELVRRRRWWPF